MAMSRKIRWGILGTGTIAQKFATALAETASSELTAVGSRSIEKAQQFAARHGCPKSLGSYEDLVRVPELDVVYIATPHVYHKDHCLLALDADKAVLCEKPFTTTADELEQIIDAAQSKGLFCMEAMWLRFNPLIHKVQELLAQGAIGELEMLRADVGYSRTFEKASRFFDPALGGGVLLDLGVYPLSLAYLLLGEPEEIVGKATVCPTGVDEQASLVLAYPNKIASLSCSFRTTAPNDAHIMGTHGRIWIHPPMYNPSGISISKFEPSSGIAYANLSSKKSLKHLLRMPRRLHNFVRCLNGRDAEQIIRPAWRNGMVFEAEEVVKCLQSGEKESSLMPLDESLRVMRAIDSIRQDWGTFLRVH